MVYKLVARAGDEGWKSVAKASENKASHGGEKLAVRTLEDGVAVEETIFMGDPTKDDAADASRGRALQVDLVRGGAIADEYRGAAGVAKRRASRGRTLSPSCRSSLTGCVRATQRFPPSSGRPPNRGVAYSSFIDS